MAQRCAVPGGSCTSEWTGDTGEIIAAELTTNDVDDASQVSQLLDQVVGPVASLTGDGAYDQDRVYRAVIERDPDAAVIVPPRSTAMLSETADAELTQRGPPSPVHCREGQDGLAEGVGLQQTQQD
jgi:hypothetical protein